MISIEQGYDPREFSLVAFGGAGPLHANSLGKLLGAYPVIIPPSPGLMCALGDATTTKLAKLSPDCCKRPTKMKYLKASIAYYPK